MRVREGPTGGHTDEDEPPETPIRRLELFRPDGGVAAPAKTGIATRVRLDYAVTEKDLSTAKPFKCRISKTAPAENAGTNVTWLAEYPVLVSTATFDGELLNDLVSRFREDVDLKVHLDRHGSYLSCAESVHRMIGGLPHIPAVTAPIKFDMASPVILFAGSVAAFLAARLAGGEVSLYDLNGALSQLRLISDPHGRPLVELLVEFETVGAELRKTGGIEAQIDLTDFRVLITWPIYYIPVNTPLAMIGCDITLSAKIPLWSDADGSAALRDILKTHILTELAKHVNSINSGLTAFLRAIVRLEPDDRVYHEAGVQYSEADQTLSIKHYKDIPY